MFEFFYCFVDVEFNDFIWFIVIAVEFYINKAVDEFEQKNIEKTITDIKDRLFEITNEITKLYGLLLLTGNKPDVEQTQTIVDLLTEQEELITILNDLTDEQ